MNKIITDAKYILCVNNFAEENITGCFFTSYLNGSVQFRGYAEMLNTLDLEMDRINYPEKTTERRTFIENEKVSNEKEEVKKFFAKEDILSRRGEKATFVLDVHHRENSTWQGNIDWIEGNESEHFKSEIEMIVFIQKRLNA